MEHGYNSAQLNNDLSFPLQAEDDLKSVQPVDNNATSITVTSASSSRQLNMKCLYLYPTTRPSAKLQLSHYNIVCAVDH